MTSSPARSLGIPTRPKYLCGRRAELRFTVRRPASAEVSPCCHRPSGGDVACSVHVGVARPCVAGFALENRLALAVSGCDVPARRASLRRVCSRDLLDPTVSLVLQTRGEQTPSASAEYHGSDHAFVRPAGRAARRFPAQSASLRARRGLRCGSCRSAARCPCWPFRPSPCAGLSPAPSASRSPASCELAARSRAWRGPASAAAPSTAWLHRGSGRGRAAVRRSTMPPTPQHRGRYPPRCPHPGRRSDQGCGRTRYASGRPDRA